MEFCLVGYQFSMRIPGEVLVLKRNKGRLRQPALENGKNLSYYYHPTSGCARTVKRPAWRKAAVSTAPGLDRRCYPADGFVAIPETMW